MVDFLRAFSCFAIEFALPYEYYTKKQGESQDIRLCSMICRWRGSTRRKRRYPLLPPNKKTTESRIGWRQLGICAAQRRKYGGFNRHIRYQKSVPPRGRHALLVPVAGVEPARVISPKDFESSSSANSNTPACPTIIARRKSKVKRRKKKTALDRIRTANGLPEPHFSSSPLRCSPLSCIMKT